MSWRLVSRSSKPRGEAAEQKKRRRRTRRFLVILGCIVALVLAVEAWISFYLFGALNTDKEFRQYTGEELGVVSIEADVSVPVAESAELISVEADTGELLYSVIPDDVLEQYYSGTGKILRRRLLDGAQDIQVFVLYGIDTREDYDTAATDAIMVVGLDPVHHKIKLISLSRDSYVYYPACSGMTKLNYTYTFDGIPGAVNALNTNFFLDVTDYIAVGMGELGDVVELMGGVTVTLTQEEIGISSALRGLTPGVNLLNGEQATSYARIRSIDDDTHRSNRQFAVIQSLLQTAQHTSYGRYPSLIRACLKLCTTSFSMSDLLSMSTLLLDNRLTIEHHYLPDAADAWGGEIDGHWYYVYDTLEASDQLHRILYEDLYESEFIDAAE